MCVPLRRVSGRPDRGGVCVQVRTHYSPDFQVLTIMFPNWPHRPAKELLRVPQTCGLHGVTHHSPGYLCTPRSACFFPGLVPWASPVRVEVGRAGQDNHEDWRTGWAGKGGRSICPCVFMRPLGPQEGMHSRAASVLCLASCLLLKACPSILWGDPTGLSVCGHGAGGRGDKNQQKLTCRCLES